MSTVDGTIDDAKVDALMVLAQKLAKAWHETESNRAVAARWPDNERQELRAAIEAYGRAEYERGRAAEAKYAHPVRECEACLTPDACDIRGQCAHFLREREQAEPSLDSPVRGILRRSV